MEQWEGSKLNDAKEILAFEILKKALEKVETKRINN